MAGGGDEPWNKMWCTKDDVMQDLALATGGGLEVEDHFLVYGERPPPRVEYHIDDEMKLLFGGEAGDVSHDQGFSKPDLKGIMSMIRMVESEDDELYPNTKQTAQPTEVIVISKLNPNVKEFVPKSDNVGQQHTKQSPGADQKVKKTLTLLSNTISTQHRSSPTQSYSKTTRNCSTPTQYKSSPTKMISSPSRNTSVPTQSNSTPTKTTQSSITPTQSRTTPTQSRTTPTQSNTTPTQSRTTPAQSSTTPAQSSTTPTQSSTAPTQSSSSPTQSSSKTTRSSTPAQSTCTEAEIQSLKDKIVSAPARDSYEHRREKNAAIATLLRHCTTLPIKTVKEKPIKLYTPEFFERCKAADFKGTFGSNSTDISKNDNEDDPAATIETDITNFISEHTKGVISKDTKYVISKDTKDVISKDTRGIISKDTTNVISKDTRDLISKATKDVISKENEDVTEDEHTQLTPEIDINLKIDDAEAEPTPSYEEIEQQKSIAKVTEWLKGPMTPKEERPKPVVMAGPTAYKRKEVMSPMSSTSSIVIDKKISRQEAKAFVPSSFARELRQKYEKNKIIENKSLNIWDNLENQLKKKDEEVKQKRGQE